MIIPERIPVLLLSGFLGSGKSTLVNAYLNDPMVQDTAVVINEFGKVPVDHLLVRCRETTISQVSTGCLCCSDTTDINRTLDDLSNAALEGTTGGFSRVIVEMSGLGDPAPLVNALTVRNRDAHKSFNELRQPKFYLAGVVTLFDTIAGAGSVENHFEALKQIAFADRIVLTKTDLTSDTETSENLETLSHELRELNAEAEIIDRRSADLLTLFSPRPYTAVDRGEDVAGWLALEAVLALETASSSHSEEIGSRSRHGLGIRTFSIVSDKPLSEMRLHRFLNLLQNSAGHRMLRVKGIVATEEASERPLIIHAVQHSVSDPIRLTAWPDEDRRTRLVFITDGIDPDAVRQLFAAVIDAVPFSFSKSFKSTRGALLASFSRTFSNFVNMSRRSQ